MVKLNKQTIQLFTEQFEKLIPKEWKVFECLGLSKSGKVVFKAQKGGLGNDSSHFLLSPEYLARGEIRGVEFNRFNNAAEIDGKHGTLWQKFNVEKTHPYYIDRKTEILTHYKEYPNGDYMVWKQTSGKPQSVTMNSNMQVTQVEVPELGAASWLDSAKSYATSKGVPFEPTKPAYPNSQTAYQATSNMLHNLWSR